MAKFALRYTNGRQKIFCSFLSGNSGMKNNVKSGKSAIKRLQYSGNDARRTYRQVWNAVEK